MMRETLSYHEWEYQAGGSRNVTKGQTIMNRSFLGILDQLEVLLGTSSLADAQKLDRIFNDHPDFWFNPDADRRLRIAITLEVKRLVEHDENMATNLADILIRHQAGLPPREEDVDPVYEDYSRRTGDHLMLDETTEIEIIGPCPASPFRWAAVMRLDDQAKWPMSWVVLSSCRPMPQV